MLKKNLVILLSILMIFLPVQAIAAQSLDGTVTSLNIGEPAPYAGILLDPIAASKMLVDQNYLKLELELKLRKEFQEEFASKKLAFDLLKTEHDSLSKLHFETMKLKNNQIDRLNETLKEEINDHSQWWLLAGTIAGIVLSVSVFYASVEVVK